MAAVSYVTGSHNFKTGFSHAWGTEEQHRFNNGDIGRIRIRNRAAYEVQAGNWPWIRKNSVNETGWFVQNAWTIDRVTVTGGLRADWLNGSVPPQSMPAGRFIGPRDFAAVGSSVAYDGVDFKHDFKLGGFFPLPYGAQVRRVC